MGQKPCDGQYFSVLHKAGHTLSYYRNVEPFQLMNVPLNKSKHGFCLFIFICQLVLQLVILCPVATILLLIQPFSTAVIGADTKYSLLQLLPAEIGISFQDPRRPKGQTKMSNGYLLEASDQLIQVMRWEAITSYGLISHSPDINILQSPDYPWILCLPAKWESVEIWTRGRSEN